MDLQTRVQKGTGPGAVGYLLPSPIGLNLELNLVTVLIQMTEEHKIMHGFIPIFLDSGMTIGMTLEEA